MDSMKDSNNKNGFFGLTNGESFSKNSNVVDFKFNEEVQQKNPFDIVEKKNNLGGDMTSMELPPGADTVVVDRKKDDLKASTPENPFSDFVVNGVIGDNELNEFNNKIKMKIGNPNELSDLFNKASDEYRGKAA